MNHYRSKIRDTESNLLEVLGIKRLCASAPYDDLDPATLTAESMDNSLMDVDEASF